MECGEHCVSGDGFWKTKRWSLVVKIQNGNRGMVEPKVRAKDEMLKHSCGILKRN